MVEGERSEPGTAGASLAPSRSEGALNHGSFLKEATTAARRQPGCASRQVIAALASLATLDLRRACLFTVGFASGVQPK